MKFASLLILSYIALMLILTAPFSLVFGQGGSPSSAMNGSNVSQVPVNSTTLMNDTGVGNLTENRAMATH
jgi:hypothetical protein